MSFPTITGEVSFPEFIKLAEQKFLSCYVLCLNNADVEFLHWCMIGSLNTD